MAIPLDWMDVCTQPSRQSVDDSASPTNYYRQTSDYGGGYVLTFKCGCGHTRIAQPEALAGITGWDALLADVFGLMWYSHCEQARMQRHGAPRDMARRLGPLPTGIHVTLLGDIYLS